MMIKLIEEDADSFSRRAEMYYEKRPELIKLVEHFYRAYRALAEQYDHATAELRHAHHIMSATYPSHSPLPPAPESPPLSSTNLFSADAGLPPDGETEDVVRLLKTVEQLTTERETLINERDALLNERDTLKVSTAVHEAEARTLKERCSELEKPALLGWKADIESMSLEIRSGISALGKWGADIRDIKARIRDLKTESSDPLRTLLEENLNLRKEKDDLLENIQCERDTVHRELDGFGELIECSEQTTHVEQLKGIKARIKDLKTESSDSLRNLLEENLNLRKEKEDLLENIQCERDTVHRELDGLGKLLECSEQTTHAEQLREITVNLVKLLEKKTRLEERQLAYADVSEARGSLDRERRRWLIFVLFCGARLIMAEDEVRRLRQLADDTGRRYAELAKVSADLTAELEGECLIQKAEAEFLSGENGRLEAGIGEISGFFEYLYGDGPVGGGLGETMGRIREGLVRAGEERERLVVENSVLCVLLEGLSVSGAEAYRDIEKENEDFAVEVLDTSGMCVVLEDLGKEKEEEGGRLRRDLDRLRRVNRRLEEELRVAGVGRGREAEVWEGEAAGFYFDLQVSAVWELVFENTVSEMVLRCSHFEKESRLNRVDAEKMRGRVRELEAELEGLRARLLGYVTAVDSPEGVLHPEQGHEPSEPGLLIQRMQTRLKEEKLKNKKLETALKAVQQLRPRKPKRGPRKPTQESGAHHSPCGPGGDGVVVKDILLDRVSKEPMVGLWEEAENKYGRPSSSFEEGVENGRVQPRDGSWTMSYSSHGSSSSRSITDEVEKQRVEKSEKMIDWWGALIGVRHTRNKGPGLCGCLRPFSPPRPNN